jgi:hypothetical protein
VKLQNFTKLKLSRLRKLRLREQSRRRKKLTGEGDGERWWARWTSGDGTSEFLFCSEFPLLLFKEGKYS